MDDAECSELCSCGESLTLTCHALCVPFAPCRTALAFYSHASPAYQAFRGRCLCYSGRFICMKPPLGEYTLPGTQINESYTGTTHSYSIYIPPPHTYFNRTRHNTHSFALEMWNTTIRTFLCKIFGKKKKNKKVFF